MSNALTVIVSHVDIIALGTFRKGLEDTLEENIKRTYFNGQPRQESRVIKRSTLTEAGQILTTVS